VPRPCTQDLFTAQAERTPEAVAVIFEDQKLTYRELNERANQLGHHLQRLGVRTNVPIGVYMHRSVEMITALLGILKAGAAYLPLDPNYPKERQAFVLEDTQLPVLLTQSALLPDLPPHESRVLGLDPAWKAVAGERRDNPSCVADEDCLAYILYTSGSTGRPKGILVPHRGLSNYLTWATAAYGVTAGSGAPLFTSISFDLTITSLFPPLLVGGTVHILPEGSGVDALRHAFGTGLNYSLVKITPAHLELLGQVLEPQKAAGGTRVFVIGGENLTSRQIAFWQTFAPDTVLVNEYGPTETVVGCCTYRVPPGKQPPGSVPIGKPIANTRLHVLDARMRPVSPGTPGELAIGGAGLAWGYHNRPDLTAEQFVPDPFSGEAGARLYRTGDLVRTLPDGNLEFLGRIDHQVKVHGYRIELGEIETVLGQHPSVRQAAVLARHDALGEKRLVAYVVPRPHQALTIADVRTYLESRLPHYMIPPVIVFLDELPLTANGKVDHQALPATVRTQLELTGQFVPPRNSLEVQMAHLWEEILGVRPIGTRDNFFELGGESLLAARLCAQIQKVFHRELSPRTLLEAPTVEQLVERTICSHEPASSSLVLLQSQGERPPFFCVHGIGGDVLGFAELARLLGAEQPFYGIQARRPVVGQEPAASLEALAAQYLEEVRAVQPQGPYYLGGFSFGATVAYEMAQQLRGAGEGVALLAILDNRSCPGSSKIRLHPSVLVEFLRNVPAWIHYDLFQSRPGALLTRLWVKAKTVTKRILGMFRLSKTAPHKPGVETLFLVSHLPKPYLEQMDIHFRALMDYVPRPYPGRVTLFRARAQGLLHFVPPDLGWGDLAPGRVEKHVIPGDHNSILHTPYVQTLAARLRASLEDAHQKAQTETLWTDAVPNSSWLAAGETRPALDNGHTATRYKVVVNLDSQYSIWPVDRENPPGWQDVGHSGTKAECLAHIRAVWTDGCWPKRRCQELRRDGPTHGGTSGHHVRGWPKTRVGPTR
jgi:amino acid adenylation domain-containing protein